LLLPASKPLLIAAAPESALRSTLLPGTAPPLLLLLPPPDVRRLSLRARLFVRSGASAWLLLLLLVHTKSWKSCSTSLKNSMKTRTSSASLEGFQGSPAMACAAATQGSSGAMLVRTTSVSVTEGCISILRQAEIRTRTDLVAKALSLHRPSVGTATAAWARTQHK
jgi:hypothetical protein